MIKFTEFTKRDNVGDETAHARRHDTRHARIRRQNKMLNVNFILVFTAICKAIAAI